MADVPAQVISRTNPPTPAYAAASAGGDTFPAGRNIVLHVKNTGASPVTATAATPGKVSELDIADATLDLPATTGDKFWGPFPEDLFAGPNGLVSVSWSQVTGVTFAVLALPG